MAIENGSLTTNPAQNPDTDCPDQPGLEFAQFAAGCFWGVEQAFQGVEGVLKTEVGYSQGHVPDPNYKLVCTGSTDHAEVVRLQFDPSVCPYTTLLAVFWARHDPTTLNRQGKIVGTQYRSGIYYYNPNQARLARESLEEKQKQLEEKIVTEILPAKTFYRAEEYHQKYLEKNGGQCQRQAGTNGCTPANPALKLDLDVPEKPGLEFAQFAAGCFWGVEQAFQRVEGVVKTEVGYSQGHVVNPNYKLVCTGSTNHAEVVRIQFDPSICPYTTLLSVFWGRHDPTTLNRQGKNVGTQYRSGIYYYNEEQARLARESKDEKQKELEEKTIVTEILPAKTFYRAEEYHQKYLDKNGGTCQKQAGDTAKACNGAAQCYVSYNS